MAAATPPSRPRHVDLVGDEWDVLCVKGSGWDMGVIEPQGLPAVKLGALLKARKLPKLSDEDMVALQRANLIDPSSPNPSVETLLHAFLPHKFVDHTHSTAMLGLVDQDNSEEICRKVLRQDVRLRALHHAGLRSRQGGGRSVRAGHVRRSA